MNKDWGTQILDKWASQGCRPEVDRRLGYRLSLTAASLPTSLPRGTTFLAQVFLSNTGWAAPISNRPVQLGLRNTSTGSVSYLPFRGVSTKAWYPGTSIPLAERFGVASPGKYALVLRLPDASPALAGPKALDPLDPESTASLQRAARQPERLEHSQGLQRVGADSDPYVTSIIGRMRVT